MRPARSIRWLIAMVGFIWWLACALSGALAPLQQVNYEDDHRHDQQDVDEPASGVGSDHAEKPEDAQNDEDCPKHCCSSLTRDRELSALVSHRGKGFESHRMAAVG
jgi:hypothetical protein